VAKDSPIAARHVEDRRGLAASKRIADELEGPFAHRSVVLFRAGVTRVKHVIVGMSLHVDALHL
jgi:hypothetical protein